MDRINLAHDLNLSRIVHGHWRIGNWQMSTSELSAFIEELIDLGITSFDHADIYGNYSCESIFGEVLEQNKSLRSKIEIITKCGIKLLSDKFPERQKKHYDYSYDHIITSVENSLRNLHTDHIDILLLHRPAPFFEPETVAKAFSDLKKDGKVLHFGVSNFTPGQFEMLGNFTDEKLVTNQVEISPYCLESFENGNIDFFMKEKIKPMAWSPLAGGRLFDPSNEKGSRVLRVIYDVAEELDISPVEQVIYAWLLKHPASILPVVGSGKIDRVKMAVDAMNLEMSLEQWYKIYIAALGKELP